MLDLQRTQITDAGLKSLTDLKSLSIIDLKNTRISDSAVKELRKALPKAFIDR